MYDNSWFTKPLPGTPYNKAHSLARGLLLYWPLNEGGGLRANDVSGSNRHGIITGTEKLWFGSPMGGSFYCDGINDAEDSAIQYTATNVVNNTYSVSLWIKPNVIAAKNLIHTRSGADLTFDIQLSANGLHGDIGTGAGWITTSADYTGGALPTNRWTHIAQNVFKTGWQIYLNGVLRASGTYASNTPLLWDVGRVLSVGVAGGTGMNGFFDEVRVYNRVLTPQEVMQLYITPHIDFVPSKKWINPTLYGLGAWNGKLIGSGATGTLTADSVNNTVEAGMAISLKKA